jgi:pimeloyl-ACP methyl ester carboxylesterase
MIASTAPSVSTSALSNARVSETLISLTHARKSKHRRAPILLVPGSFSGAWIWRDSFMPALHKAGHDVHAMSFAAHGKRGWALHQRGLKDYVADLRTVIATLPQAPIIVAHSLGGLVAMQLAESQALRGLALLSPIPIQGAWRSLLALARKSPTSLGKMLALAIDTRVTRLGSAPLGIYSNAVPSTRAEQFNRQLKAESLRLLFESLFPARTSSKLKQTPMHFFAAHGDHLIPAAEVQRCAESLNAPITIYPGMSHSFQAEPSYENVCRDIVRWANTIA